MITLPHIKALFFDKDGTLFDFNRTWTHFCAKLLDAAIASPKTRIAAGQAIGFDVRNNCFVQGSVVVNGTAAELLDILSPFAAPRSRSGLAVLAQDLLETVQPVPVPGLATALEAFSEQGLILAVITNDNESAARAQLEALGTAGYFSAILGADSGPAPKPAPDTILSLCERFGILPQQVAMIGDSLHDLHAAQAAGAFGIGVLSGPATKQHLMPDCDLLLTDIGELMGYFNSPPARR